MPDFKALWDSALTFDAFVAAASGHHRALWEGIYRIARLPEWAAGLTAPEPRRFLVIAEDWCGDAVNTIPILAKLVNTMPALELRIVLRDPNPALMDQYLTNGSRSIPIVIVLDEEFRELGQWGPRPSVLQAWVMANRGTIPKAELYPQVRTWYARDRGESTVREVMEIAGAIPAVKTSTPTPPRS